MSLSVAIVGLPNVGKSTLFNALLKRQVALAANYPFATIEPNVGIVEVPDKRLAVLAKIVNTEVIKPALVEFVDIAGLIKGASKGEGLGNKFLANIRECSTICHVLRAFSDENILKEGSVNPKEDLEIVRIELQLADLQTLEKQQEPKGTTAREEKDRWEIIKKFKQSLGNGQLVLSTEEEQQVAKELGLLSAKKEIFVINVDESTNKYFLESEWAKQLGVDSSQVVINSAKLESELSSLASEDQKLYLSDLGLEESGLERLAAVAYKTLSLQSFLTAGEKEVRAWTIKQNTKAPEAAGVIHTDFTKKFIKANVCSFTDFVEFGGWGGVREKGKLRQEGKDYVLHEGDVVEFMIGK